MPKSLVRRISKSLFVIANVLTALCFLIGCYSQFFTGIGWWFAGFFTLGAFYLLIVLLLFMGWWLFFRPRLSLISLIAILAAIKPVYNILPFRFSSSFEPQAAGNHLRIMSWNVAQFDILYNKRKPETRDAMLALVNQYEPDVACFQEMVAGDTLVNLNTDYYKKYSFFSIYEYASKLNFPHFDFTYQSQEDFLNRQHFGLVIFSRYPIINHKRVSFDPYDYNSSFHYADIVKNADTFRVFNIHLQSLKFSPGNLDYIENPSLETRQDIKRSRKLLGKFKTGFLKRKLQAERVAAEIAQSPYPVIVCGDFNDVPNSYAYSTIGQGLNNAFVEKGAGLGRTFSGIAPTLRIDNIFVSKAFTVHQFGLVDLKLSDHFPVIADLSR